VIFEIKFTPEAEQTFDAVVEQINLNWGDKVLVGFEDKMIKSLSLISRNPLIFPMVFRSFKRF
jgi:hypothetical protein